MTKRIAILLIAVILPITLVFTGCGSDKPTATEYRDELRNNLQAYTEPMKELSQLADESDTVEKVQANQSKAKEACKKAGKILDNFEKITPPDRFADKHQNLISAIDSERKFLKAAEKLFAAKTSDDVESATNELTAIQNIPSDQQFLSVFTKLISEVNQAVNNG